MNYLYPSLQAFIAISFMGFGIGCFISAKASQEFKRYGLSDKQKIIGSLQVLASLGLIFAYLFKLSLLTTVIALCLTIMMFVAVIIRVKIKDAYFLIAPALFYFL